MSAILVATLGLTAEDVAGNEPRKTAVRQHESDVLDDLLQDFSGQDAAPQHDYLPDVPWLTTAPARERSRYLNTVKRLLKLLADGRASLREDAAKAYADARALCNEDPRLPLAYGLYLQKIAAAAEARDIFEASAQHAGKSYVPILQAAAMSRLTTRDYHRTWPWLEKTAHVISHPPTTSYPSLLQRRQAADWLGATGAWLVSLPAETDGAHLLNLPALRAQLPAELQPIFDAGQARTENQLAELQKLTKETAGDAAQKLRAAQAKVADKLKVDRANAEALTESIRQQSMQLGEAQKEEKELRSELARVNNQRQSHQETVAELSEPRVFTEMQMQSRRIRGRRVQTPVEVTREENAKERADRLQKLQEASAKLTTAQSRAVVVKKELELAKSQRMELTGRVRQQTAGDRAKLAQLKQNIESLDRLRDRLNRLANEPEKLAARLQSPEILLDWSLQDVADRLRATFDPPKSLPQEKPDAG